MDTAPRMTRSRAKAIAEDSTTPAALSKATRMSKTSAGKALKQVDSGFTPAAVSKLAFSEKDRNDTTEDSDQNATQEPLQLSPLPEVAAVNTLPTTEEQTPELASGPAETPSTPAPAEEEVAEAAAPAADVSAEEPTPVLIQAVEPEQALEVQQNVQDDTIDEVTVDAVPPASALKPQLIAAIESMEQAVESAFGDMSPAPTVSFVLNTPCDALSPGPPLQLTPGVMEQVSATPTTVPAGVSFQYRDSAAQTPASVNMQSAAEVVGTGEVHKRVSISTPMVHHAVSTSKKCGIVYTPYPKSESAETDEEAEMDEDEEMGDVQPSNIAEDILNGASPMAATPQQAATPMAVTPQQAATPMAVTPQQAATPMAVTPQQAATPVQTATPQQAATPQHVSVAHSEMPLGMMSPAFADAPVASPAQPSASEQQPDSLAVTVEAAGLVSVTEASKPKMKSTVVTASPYDPRSLRQLKKEIKAVYAAKEEEAAKEEALHEDDGETEAAYDEDTENLLASAMGDLGIAMAPNELRGMPLALGSHVRFDDDGAGELSPTSGKINLRGLPEHAGNHVRFD